MRRIAGRFDVSTLLLVGVAVALVGAYWAALTLSRDYYTVEAPAGSTFNSQEDGLKVLYAYLDELGIERSALESFDELPEGGTIVVAAAEPFAKAPTSAEVRRLETWVEGGGTLLLVGPAAGDVAGKTAGGTSAGGGEATLQPRLPSVYVQGVESVRVGTDRLLMDSPTWATSLKDSSGQVLVSRAQGKGQIVWLSSLYPVSNSGIDKADNARLATLLVASRQPVYFDEYHHGFVKGGGVWGRLGDGGRAATVLGALAVALLLFAAARRLGPPIDAAPVRTVRTGAYIASLADLYRRAGARAPALATLSEGLRVALARRYGTVEAGLERDSSAADVLARAADAIENGTTEQGFVAIARDIARARQEVEGRDG